MKFAVFIMIFGFSTVAFSQGENFEARKAEATKEIEERIAKLQEHKSCVSAASDQEALKKCRESMKEFRQEEKAERLNRRKERLQKRIDKQNTQ